MLARIAGLSGPFGDGLLDGPPDEDLVVCLSVFDRIMIGCMANSFSLVFDKPELLYLACYRFWAFWGRRCWVARPCAGSADCPARSNKG